MKRKYYAYLHANDHWVIKCWVNKKRFMEILEDGFNKDSNVKGMIMPFEIDFPLKERDIEKEGQLIITCLNDIEPMSIKDSPALLYIRAMINRIDWNKG